MMLFNEYQQKAMETRLASADMTYALLGLAGEAGEVANKAAKAVRDDWDEDRLREELKGELGDVLWMVAAICSDLHIGMNEVAQLNINKLRDRANRGKIAGSGDKR